MTSVVQIFFQDKMAAVAHVIGTEQLPMKSQVKLDRLCILTCILLNYNLICSNAFIANDVKTTYFPIFINKIQQCVNSKETDRLKSVWIITIFFLKISGNLSLNPSEKERAILIKTGEGDSMILVGKWTGFVRGVPGIKGIIFKTICP